MTTIIRTSERATFERCKAQWWWAWREGLVHRTKRQDALWFGEGVHLAFARWYTGPGTARGVEPAETWEEWAREGLASVKTMFDTEDEERIARYEDAAELGRVMLEGHRARYGRDEHMSIVQPEHSWHLDIPYPDWQEIWVADETDVMARLVGTYDKVYQDLRDGDYWLGETKTAASISLRHLNLDNQAGTYWATATNELRRRGVLKKSQSIRGIEYDFLRKALPDDRPRDAEGYATNKPTKAHYAAALEAHTGSPDAAGKPWMKLTLEALEATAERAGLKVQGDRSKVQPPPLFLRHQVHRTRAENRAQLLRAQDQAMEMELFRRGMLKVTKNPTRECNFCAFYDMCELQERGGDWETFRDLSYRAEDPYANHRIKSAAE
jgi:hypothetical protein